MSNDDVCGSENTTTGEPCQFSPADSCPWHTGETSPDTGRTCRLERQPELIDLVCDRLAAGDTIAEACAEVDISEHQYYEWNRKGDPEGDDLYAEFAKETERARRQAGKRDRAQLRQAMRDADDTRGWLKLHMAQYGDAYGDEETDMRGGTEIIIHDTEETYMDAIKN